MFDEKKLRAIGMMLGRTARTRAEAEDVEANEVIDLTPLLRAWKPGAKTVGMVETYEGYPYKCIRAHDSTGNESWNPKEASSLWANYHGTDAAHALQFVQPTGAHDAYMTGEYAIWNETVKRCIVDNTVHDPDTLPGSWE